MEVGQLVRKMDYTIIFSSMDANDASSLQFITWIQKYIVFGWSDHALCMSVMLSPEHLSYLIIMLLHHLLAA
jgi:hypothetical protein